MGKLSWTIILLSQIPIAVLWHCEENWFQSFYLDSSAASARGVFG